MPTATVGRIFATSRHDGWSTPFAELALSALEPQAAADVLGIGSMDPDARAANRLVDILGGSPLVLRQTAALVRAIGTSLADHLSRITRDDNTAHASDPTVTRLGPVPPIPNRPSPLELTRVTIETSRNRSPRAAELAMLCTAFASAPVPAVVLERLERPACHSDVDVSDGSRARFVPTERSRPPEATL